MMEVLETIKALAPLLIICLVSIILAIWFIRKAVRNDAHRVRNVVLAVVFILIPILLYAFLYILGRILTG